MTFPDAIQWRFRLLRACFPYVKGIHITAKQAEKYIFAFYGEFGFEMLLWAPYIKYLKEHLNFRLTVGGRIGGQFMYPFADEYIEIPRRYFGETLSDDDFHSYPRLGKLFTPVSRKDGTRNFRALSVDGIDYHGLRIEEPEWKLRHYSPLDFSGIQDPLPFETTQPIAVISNKTYTQMIPDKIFNGFPQEDLILLRDFLLLKGFFIVYNCCPDSTPSGVDLQIQSENVFPENDKRFFSFSALYKQKNLKEMNRLQISLYNKASVVFTPQGGAAYPSALCGKKTFVRMRQGPFNECKHLAEIGHCMVKPFYEVPDIIATIDRYGLL